MRLTASLLMRVPERLARDLLDLAGRDALEIHLEHGLFERAGHAPVALEDLGEERHLSHSRHADLLDVAGGGREGASVVAVTLAEAALGALAVLGLELGRPSPPP